MLGLRSATRGPIAAALLIATLALGSLGLVALLPVSPHANAAPAGTHAAVHPAAGTANISFTNTLPSPATVPVTLNYTITASSGVTSANLSVSITFSAGPANTVLSTNAGPAAPGPNSVTLGYTALAGSSAIPTTNWNFTATVAVDGTATGAASLTAATATVLNPVVALTSNVSVYSTFPINATFTVGISGNSGVTPSAANVMVGIDFDLTQGTCAVLTGFGCFVWNPIVVINQSLPFSASGNYAYQFTAANVSPILFNGGNLPTATYSIAPWAIVTNSSNPSVSRAVSSAQTTRFTANSPSGAILSPVNTTLGLAVGANITIAVTYSGDYVASAVVSVISEATKAVTFAGGVFSPGNGGHGGALSWTPGSTGKYDIVLTLTFINNYTAPFSANVTGVAVGAAGTGGGGGGITYLNTTHWVNQTYLQGFSPAVGGTLLLVAGLIVGMLVAAILGRMMWSRPAAQPAQAWQQKSGTTPAGMSECSVCHQTFNTPAELVEHQKTAHGM